jgi:hypothetical protein
MKKDGSAEDRVKHRWVGGRLNKSRRKMASIDEDRCEGCRRVDTVDTMEKLALRLSPRQRSVAF